MPPVDPAARTVSRAALALLLLATLLVFAGALRCGFVHDDRQYVLQNPGMALGLSPRGVAWAFTSFHASNWHPLTWLSHLADGALFGRRAAGHHAVSVALHALNAVLLASVLRAATGAFWPALLASSAFALHPLRVESVAWVAERKDVLSLLFGLLTVAAHVRWARRPTPARYLLVAAALAAGLLAKPMLVTLPLCLLLLDLWPLGRLLPRRGVATARTARTAALLAAEKLPLLLLAAGAAALTLAAQSRGGSLRVETRTLLERGGDAAVALARYLRMSAWPADLGVFYPAPLGAQPAAAVLPALALAAALTVAALTLWRRRPYLAFGWLWFAGTLVPVLGFVQAGLQAVADRYTYLPHVGLFTAAAWLCADAVRARRSALPGLVAAAAVALAAFAAAAALQTGFWRDEVTLYARTAAVSPGSWFARYNHGTALAEAGRLDEAAREFEEVLRLRPIDTDARVNLGHVRQSQGRTREAAALYREALRLNPRDAEAWNNLGVVLAGEGRREEAIRHVREALRLNPGHTGARMNLQVLLRRGN